MRAGDGGDDLHRLAEPHVVGEDAPDAGVPQPCEPTESVELVGAQGRQEVWWHLGHGSVLERPEGRDVGGPASALLVDDAERDELLPEVGVVGRQPQAAGLGVGELPGLVDEGTESVQLGTVEAEPRAGVEEHHLLTAGQRAEEGLEGHLLALDLDRDAEVEPVASLAATRLRSTPMAGCARFPAVGRGAVELSAVEFAARGACAVGLRVCGAEAHDGRRGHLLVVG